jgi:hypothetical protein
MRHVDWTKVRIIDMDGNPYFIEHARVLAALGCEDCGDRPSTYVIKPEAEADMNLTSMWTWLHLCDDCLVHKYERSTMDYADPDKFAFVGDPSN